jgi:hypothetical protein
LGAAPGRSGRASLDAALRGDRGVYHALTRLTGRSGREAARRVKTDVLYYGNNLEILRKYIPDESVDLVYLDPPFNSNRAYSVIFTNQDLRGRESPNNRCPEPSVKIREPRLAWRMPAVGRSPWIRIDPGCAAPAGLSSPA